MDTHHFHNHIFPPSPHHFSPFSPPDSYPYFDPPPLPKAHFLPPFAEPPCNPPAGIAVSPTTLPKVCPNRASSTSRLPSCTHHVPSPRHFNRREWPFAFSPPPSFLAPDWLNPSPINTMLTPLPTPTPYAPHITGHGATQTYGLEPASHLPERGSPNGPGRPRPVLFSASPLPPSEKPLPSRWEREMSYTKAGYHPSTNVSLERVAAATWTDSDGTSSIAIGEWEGPHYTPELRVPASPGGPAWMSGALPVGVDDDSGWGLPWDGGEWWEGGGGGGGGGPGWGELGRWDAGEREREWDRRAWEGREEEREEGERTGKKTLKREKKRGVLSSTVLVLTVDWGSEWMRECAAYYG